MISWEWLLRVNGIFMSLENSIINEANSSVLFLHGEKKKGATRPYQYMHASLMPSVCESGVRATCLRRVHYNGTRKSHVFSYIPEGTVSCLGRLSPVPWNLSCNYRCRLQLVPLKTRSLLFVRPGWLWGEKWEEIHTSPHTTLQKSFSE